MELASLFREMLPLQPESLITTLKKSTARKIRYELVNTVSQTKNDDVYVFYFNGHGVMSEDGQAHIIPYDGFTERISSTCINLKLVLDTIVMSNAAKKLIIVEACHSGVMTKKGLTLSTLTSVPPIAGFNANQSIAFISGGSAGEYMWDDGEGHGFFTKHLINGIKVIANKFNGCVELASLFNYVHSHVSLDSYGKQNPSMASAGTPFFLDFSATFKGSKSQTSQWFAEKESSSSQININGNVSGSTIIIGNENEVQKSQKKK